MGGGSVYLRRSKQASTPALRRLSFIFFYLREGRYSPREQEWCRIRINGVFRMGMRGRRNKNTWLIFHVIATLRLWAARRGFYNFCSKTYLNLIYHSL